MFVALDKAIRDRLEGNPRDRLGFPTNPLNPGVRCPVFGRTADPKNKLFDPFDVVPNQYRMVPVFKKSTAGKEWEAIFPCIVYDTVSAIPALNVWLPPVGKNKIVLPSEGHDVEIVDQAGNVIGVGKETNVEHPLPESYNILVQIEVHSKIEYEALSILRSLVQVFPQKTFLAVRQADGTTHNCDMLMQGEIDLGEVETPTLEGTTTGQGDLRERNYILTYLVEAYQDLTWPQFQKRHPAIKQPILEMTFPDMPEADNLNTTEGVLEIIDLKKLM